MRLRLFAVTAGLVALAAIPAFRSRVAGAEHDFDPSAAGSVSHEMSGVSVRTTDSPHEEPPPSPAGG